MNKEYSTFIMYDVFPWLTVCFGKYLTAVFIVIKRKKMFICTQCTAGKQLTQKKINSIIKGESKEACSYININMLLLHIFLI